MSDQKIPSQQNEKLPWKTFNWCAVSKPSHNMVYGTSYFENPVTELTVRQRVLGKCAEAARNHGMSWDPFNLDMLIKPSSQGTE